MVEKRIKRHLIELANKCFRYKDRNFNLVATRNFLVLPFFNILGYDTLNPDEVVLQPEIKIDDVNIDYIINKNNKPIIAVDCRRQKEGLNLSQSSIKKYFDKVSTVKLAILTNGIDFEFYTDNDRSSFMAEKPFLKINFLDIIENDIDDAAVNMLISLCKSNINPKNVRVEAKREVIRDKIYSLVEESMNNPKDEIVSFFIRKADPKIRITKDTLKIYRKLMKEALSSIFETKLLEHNVLNSGGFSDIDSVNKVVLNDDNALNDNSEKATLSSEEKIKIFKYARERLAYLVDSDMVFEEISNIRFYDRDNVFKVYYNLESTGTIFNVRKNRYGEYLFTFPCFEDHEISSSKIGGIDDYLIRSFHVRLVETGPLLFSIINN